MSTFTDRTATALLVVDAQTGVLRESHDRDAVVSRIAGLVDRARAAGTPVVWVQHISEELPEGSEQGQIAAELTPDAAEPRVLKRYGDSFEDTTLADELARLGAGRLVVCGAATDACVRCTIHGGFARGYDVTLVSDAHTAQDMRPWGGPIGPADAIAYTNLYWQYTDAPGREATVVAASDVTF